MQSTGGGMSQQQMNALMMQQQQQRHQQQQQFQQQHSQGAMSGIGGGSMSGMAGGGGMGGMGGMGMGSGGGGMDLTDLGGMMPPPAPPRPSTATGNMGMGNFNMSNIGGNMNMGMGNMGGVGGGMNNNMNMGGQGGMSISRPGTSMSHRSPVIPGPDIGMGGMGSMGGMGANMNMGGGGMNMGAGGMGMGNMGGGGMQGLTPHQQQQQLRIQQHQALMQQQQQQQQGSHPSQMSSQQQQQMMQQQMLQQQREREQQMRAERERERELQQQQMMQRERERQRMEQQAQMGGEMGGSRPQSRMMSTAPPLASLPSLSSGPHPHPTSISSTPRPGTPNRQLSSHSQMNSPVGGGSIALSLPGSGMPGGGQGGLGGGSISAPGTPMGGGQGMSISAGPGGMNINPNLNSGGGFAGSPPATPGGMGNAMGGMNAMNQGMGGVMGSPYRGAKRKLPGGEESPRISGSVPGGMGNMGGMGGGMQQQQQQQMMMQQAQAQRQRMAAGSPRPGSSMGMGGGMDGMGMNMNMNMGMGGGMGGGGMTPQQQQQLLQQQMMQQQQQRARQGSMPPPPASSGSSVGGMGMGGPGMGGGMGVGGGPSGLPQTPIRQGSLPPSSPIKMSGPLIGGVVSGGTPVTAPGGLPSTPTSSLPANLPPSSSTPAPSSLTLPAAPSSLPIAPAVVPSLPPLPANVSLNPSVTRVTPVPLVDSLKLIPELSQEEVENVKEWMEVDRRYEGGAYRRMRERAGEEVREAFGIGNIQYTKTRAVPALPPHLSSGGAPTEDGTEAKPETRMIVDRNWNLSGREGSARQLFWWERGSQSRNLDVYRVYAHRNPRMFSAVNQKYPNTIPQVEPFTPVYPRSVRPVGEGHYFPPEVDPKSNRLILPSGGGALVGGGGKEYKRGAARGLGAVVGLVEDRRRRRGVVQREGVRVPRRLGKEEGERVEVLVPVRLEFEVEHWRMRDTFVWNLSDPLVTPEVFAQSVVEDYSLPATYHSVIVKSIIEQLSDFKAHSFTFDDAPPPGIVEFTSSASVKELPVQDDEKENETKKDGEEDGDADGDAHEGVDTEGEAPSKPLPTSVKQPKPKVPLAERENSEDKVVRRGRLEEEDQAWWDAWKERVRAIEVLAAGGKRAKKALMKKRLAEGASASRRGHAKGKGKKEGGDAMDEDGDEGDDENDDEEDEHEDEEEEEQEDAWLLPPLPGSGKENRSLGVHEIPLNEATMHEEMRILIKLDIIVGSMKLDDQFEWDMESTEVTPEEFAEVYAKDLGLGGEFKTAIAHSIREQVAAYQKSLFLVGHPSDGTAVQDDELRQAFLPSLVSGARPVSEVAHFTPTLNYLSDGEIERTEKEREKDLNRRRKRNTRGRRGVALPDREPMRTYRTPAIGFPELDAATLALAAAANAPVSRRAAAAAASVTIANMVASENGQEFPTTNNPRQNAQATPAPNANAQKEKKVKGLFKAPNVPSSVLNKRANVVAPTPSTAVGDLSALPAPLEDDPPLVMPAPQIVYDASGVPRTIGGANAAMKFLTAKRAKELEREAKAQEFVDGQHPNYIDGVWHCSNCGCPESIAVGRRKGPLGDKSQCGTCGKFWHRHRRPRPVEYNPDPTWHSGAAARRAREEAEAKTPASKKKGRVGVVAKEVKERDSDGEGPSTPGRKPASSGGRYSPAVTPAMMAKRTPSQLKNMQQHDDDDEAMSPVSSASSESEAPLASKSLGPASMSKVNGGASAKKDRDEERRRLREAEEKREREKEEKEKPATTTAGRPVASSSAVGTPGKVWPPDWLTTAMHAMQRKYPNDKFDVILRKTAASTPEWRIKCLDCPGKLYTPGPNESLTNYEVHLKNRLHRNKVNDRLAGRTTAPTSASGSATPARKADASSNGRGGASSPAAPTSSS